MPAGSKQPKAHWTGWFVAGLASSTSPPAVAHAGMRPQQFWLPSEADGPGPLVSQLVAKQGGRMRVPVTVVPGSLSLQRIDEIS